MFYLVDCSIWSCYITSHNWSKWRKKGEKFREVTTCNSIGIPNYTKIQQTAVFLPIYVLSTKPSFKDDSENPYVSLDIACVTASTACREPSISSVTSNLSGNSLELGGMLAPLIMMLAITLKLGVLSKSLKPLALVVNEVKFALDFPYLLSLLQKRRFTFITFLLQYFNSLAVFDSAHAILTDFQSVRYFFLYRSSYSSLESHYD